MSHVPARHLAYMARAKVVDYLLNPAHPQGAAKSIYFSRFGFEAASWRVLEAALLQHVNERPVDRVTETPNGTRYVVRCNIASPDGRNPCIVTVWEQDRAGLPRLITAYPA